MHFVRRRRWVRTRSYVGPTRARSDAGGNSGAIVDAAVAVIAAKRHTSDSLPHGQVLAQAQGQAPKQAQGQAQGQVPKQAQGQGHKVRTAMHS